METKHTPGPWKVDYSMTYNWTKATAIKVVSKNAVHVSGTKEQLIYFRHLNDGMDEESEANARLIASAPELLVALNWINDRLNHFGNIDLVRDEEVIEVMQAAINKATK